MANDFEVAARRRKVNALMAVAVAREVRAEEVATDDWIRRMLVAVSEVNEPSMETWQGVVEALSILEEFQGRLNHPAFSTHPGGDVA